MSAAARLAAVAAELWPRRPSPVGFARVDAVPEGVQRWQGPATSACQFWREGTARLFAAGPDHGACPVGLLTQGFASEPPPGGIIELMAEIGYIDPGELAHLPALPAGHQAIVYGPLAVFPIEPEAVLVLADAEQLMLLTEAAGEARLDAAGLPLGGRPTCAAIPAALAQARMRGSVACVGARVYADLGPDELLVVIPGEQAGRLADELQRLAAANRRLESVHREQRLSIRSAAP